jgi:hypothetical protein
MVAAVVVVAVNERRWGRTGVENVVVEEVEEKGELANHLLF